MICFLLFLYEYPDNKIHGTNMGPTWGRQDPGGPHFGHINLAIWVYIPYQNNEINGYSQNANVHVYIVLNDMQFMHFPKMPVTAYLLIAL